MTDLLRKKIKQIVDVLIESCEIETPVDLQNLVTSLGGEITTLTEESSVFGSVKRIDNNRFIISVSPNQNEHRKRFTVAHELGHLFLHMGFPEEKTENVEMYRIGASEQEYQANEFAACLLMPEKEFIEVVMSNTDNSSAEVNINAVAQYFNVSETSAINRGRWLGIIQW